MQKPIKVEECVQPKMFFFLNWNNHAPIEDFINPIEKLPNMFCCLISTFSSLFFII
jgi:hypothetical protein